MLKKWDDGLVVLAEGEKEALARAARVVARAAIDQTVTATQSVQSVRRLSHNTL